MAYQKQFPWDGPVGGDPMQPLVDHRDYDPDPPPPPKPRSTSHDGGTVAVPTMEVE